MNSNPQTSLTLDLHGDILTARGNGTIALKVVNILGAHVISTLGNDDADFDVALLPSGPYLAIADAGGNRVVKRIIIAH